MKHVTSSFTSSFAAAALCTAAAFAAGCATSTSRVPAGATSTSTPASPARSGAAKGTATALAGRSGSPGSPGSPTASCAGNGTGSSGGWAVTSAPFQVPPLAAVQFVGPRQGWVAGAGRIVATSDGGETWTRQYSGPDKLVQVDFIDASHGWAVGTSGLLRTTDGGATWAQLAGSCAARIRSVHFISPAVGYGVAGGSQVRLDGGVPAPVYGGTLVATTDGGATWQPVPGAPREAQTACFANADVGYLGTPGEVWRTTDGGTHWAPSFREAPPAKGVAQPQPDTAVLECAGQSAAWVQFLGWGAATGHAPYLVFATQDGQHWRAVFEESFIETAVHPEVHAPAGPGSYPGPFSVISPEEAAFVGYTPPLGYGAARLDLATSGGASLTSAGNVHGLTAPYATAFLSLSQGWVVGMNQTQPAATGSYAVVATTDGGHTWHTQYTVG